MKKDLSQSHYKFIGILPRGSATDYIGYFPSAVDAAVAYALAERARDVLAREDTFDSTDLKVLLGGLDDFDGCLVRLLSLGRLNDCLSITNLVYSLQCPM